MTLCVQQIPARSIWRRGRCIGLNVGLAAGLLGAYLPDQSRLRPELERVVLVDLAAGAGVIAGATFGCVVNVQLSSSSVSAPSDRASAAGSALRWWRAGLGGRRAPDPHVDDKSRSMRPADSASTPMPMATVRADARRDGRRGAVVRGHGILLVDSWRCPSGLREVFVVDAVRTPIGRHRGALAEVRPDDLGALVIAELVRRTGVDPAGDRRRACSAAPTRPARTTATSRA